MAQYVIAYRDGSSVTVDVCALDRIRTERDGIPVSRSLEAVHRWVWHALKRDASDIPPFERWAGSVADVTEAQPPDPTRTAVGQP